MLIGFHYQKTLPKFVFQLLHHDINETLIFSGFTTKSTTKITKNFYL